MTSAPTDAPIYHAVLDTAFGPLRLAGNAQGLQHVIFGTESRPRAGAEHWRADAAPLRAAIEQIDAYLAGELTEFSLALCPQGTPFQQRAWQALQDIPYGETRSYAEQAVAIGAPQAVRAVGAANGRNPLPIVIPCHRVIGSNGSLTGFGGGLAVKQWLLRLEAMRSGLQLR